MIHVLFGLVHDHLSVGTQARGFWVSRAAGRFAEVHQGVCTHISSDKIVLAQAAEKCRDDKSIQSSNVF